MWQQRDGSASWLEAHRFSITSFEQSSVIQKSDGWLEEVELRSHLQGTNKQAKLPEKQKCRMLENIFFLNPLSHLS